MENANFLIDRMMKYYKVDTISDLATKMGIGQSAISKWRKNNSIRTIYKKCLKLGIADEIFGDLNKNIQYNEFSHATISGTGAAGVDNSKKKATKTPPSPLPTSPISYTPDYILSDLDNLFKRCGKDKKEELIKAIDNFIYEFKKNVEVNI